MASSQIAINLLIMLITFLFAAFFVACEFALVQVRPSALEEELEKRGGKSRKISTALDMVHKLNEYLSTTQVGVSVAGIILGWIGESTVESILIDLFNLDHLLSPAVLHIVGAILGVLVLTYLEVVFTEIVPKNISIDMPMQAMMFVTTPLHYFHILFYPFVWLLNTSSTGVVKLIGLQPADEENANYSQAEILKLSKNAVSGGQLERNDYIYMERAFEMNDKVAKDIMIDRTSLIVVDVTATVAEVIDLYVKEGFSRFPVVEHNDKDDILGYVYNYDLIKQAESDDSIHVSKMLRNIITVPETASLQTVLAQMVQKQTPIVVVVDEYGGTSGIVTDRDIYEELFGTVKDENEKPSEEYVLKQADETYRVNGKITLYDFERYFNVKIKSFDDSDVVTLTGFVMKDNPSIHLNDIVQIDQFSLKVADMENAYINWFEVKIQPIIPKLVESEQDEQK
ncbi:hemolysin [Loigolactobacillus backii]|uniref:hemolysin family protein n=1 Tax=Loigolactobacillus backii TaxID=375175 RepID=UPI0007F0DB00|nr:hemolysin family protein [Loigolactobacillus backii]ANK60316.1 hemolysin [Loigolactobacillus backii]ANK65196.1 hemolysin [Loigolactobacillus backii]ANK67755.1 hemolysin [Loigolactobacillus backii]OLF70487.1 hemolysin [Loigolactobacillus backii]